MAGSIHEFCAEFHISLRKAQRMEKRGWLRVDTSTTPADEIRLSLQRGAKLTAAQMVELIEHPGAVLELGRYSERAQSELEALGNATQEAAPRAVSSVILEAYENDPEAVATMVRWLKGVIPGEPVGHAYLAVRLLLGVPENVRKYDVPRIQRALMNCRNHPELAGYWRTEKHLSRKRTVYQKGTKESFDL
jgi:hypothetical protein